MSRLIIGATLLLTVYSAGLAQTPAPLNRHEIIVIGAKIADLKADVERCESGGCAVREDVIATVRYAEAEFLEGRYFNAHKALGKAVARTRKGEDSDPFAVVELQTARANVARHYGEPRDVWRASGAVTRLLEKHAPHSPSALLARMRLIEENYRRDGRPHNIAQIKALSQEALNASQPLISLRADLSRASMLYSSLRREEAREMLEQIMASRVPESAVLRLAAEVLAMRLDVREGDSSKVDALIARVTEEQKRFGPILVWAPKVPTPQGSVYAGAQDQPPVSGGQSSSTIPLRWVDIGFAIGLDGRVESVDVLRGSPRPTWAKPLTSAIAQRRYTPSADLYDLAGRYRVERYTFTADLIIPIGSRIRSRAGRPRFERLDITAAPPRESRAPSITN